MGTPCFMSPEQLRSTRDVDGRTDIWSLGAILYALLAGAPPYDGESNADVSAKIIRDDPPPLRSIRPDVPEGVEAVVQRCLEKLPAKRFADVVELAKALGEVGSDDAKRKVARITRMATAVAPTMKSTSSPTPAVGGAGSGADRPGSARTPLEDLIVDANLSGGSNPTRTASSWGETSGVDKKRRAVPLGALVLLACVMAAAAAFGIVKIGSGPSPSHAVSASSISAASTTADASPAIAPVVAPLAPLPSARAVAVPSATTAATSVTLAVPSAKGTSGAKPKASASASASPSAKAGGLFDDRE